MKPNQKFDTLLANNPLHKQNLPRKEFEDLKGYAIAKALVHKKYKFNKQLNRFV